MDHALHAPYGQEPLGCKPNHHSVVTAPGFNLQERSRSTPARHSNRHSSGRQCGLITHFVALVSDA